MPIIYVGRVNKFFGRPLWEILYNLKNLGAGRIVARSTFLKRYPEITYYKIVRAEPTVIEYPENMYGKILSEKIFRGVKSDELYDLGRTAYKADFVLIPKHEEEAFIKSGKAPAKNEAIYPRYVTFPPLWQELIKRDKAREGSEVTENDLRVPVVYKNTERIKVAEEDEKPSFQFYKFMPRHPHVYRGITIDKEKQARAIFKGDY